MNRGRVFGILFFCAGALFAPHVHAQQKADVRDEMTSESRRLFWLGLKFGPYLPNIDDEFKGEKPFKRVFGSSDVLLTQLDFEVQFFQKVGSAAVGFGLGFSNMQGKSLTDYDPNGGTATKSSDKTNLFVMPLSLSLVYRFDYLAVRWSVPLVPYAKVGLDYLIWWTTDDNGDVSDWAADNGSGKSIGRGGVWGWHVAGGLAILLDIFAPGMAHTFDTEIGVNNSYLFAEYFYLDADNFGTGKTLHLGDNNFQAGLAFEF